MYYISYVTICPKGKNRETYAVRNLGSSLVGGWWLEVLHQGRFWGCWYCFLSYVLVTLVEIHHAVYQCALFFMYIEIQHKS